jgi:hypothetical protein
MTIQQLRYGKEEFARRGNEIYDAQVRPQIDEISDRGKIVAIDIETGAFERNPDAQIWRVRIGHKGVHRFGVGRLL